MIDLLLLIFMNILFFLIGLPFTRLLPNHKFKMRSFTASTIGYGFSSVTITVLYRFGVSINFLFKGFIVIGFIIAIYFIYVVFKKIGANRRGLSSLNHTACVLLLIWVIGTIVLIAPKWAGGNQFAVFQGNQWDTFAYLESSAVYAKESYENILNADIDSKTQNPLRAYAKVTLKDRPAAEILYAFVASLFPHKLHFLYYTFLIFFISQAILLGLFMAVNMFNLYNPILTGLVSLAFPLGFWGQYVFDMNSWSQISSVPIMMLIVFLISLTLGNYHRDKMGSVVFIRLLIFLAILSSSALYLYPESLVFHIAVVAVLAIIYLLFWKVKKYKLSPVWLIFSSFLAGFAIGLLFPDIFRFMISQSKSAIFQYRGWWRYFDLYLFGKGLTFDLVDFLAGIFGLYFITPLKDQYFFISILLRISILVSMVYSLSILVKFLSTALNLNISGIRTKINNRKLIIFSILIFFILFPPYLGLKLIETIKFCKPVKIIAETKSSQGLSKIYFFRADHFGIPKLLNGINGVWLSENSYFTKIVMKTTNDAFNEIKKVKIEMGEDAFVYSGKEILEKWEKKKNDTEGRFIFQTPKMVKAEKSLFPIFRNCINWRGDINMIANSDLWSFALYYVILLVLLFVWYYGGDISLKIQFHAIDNKNKIGIFCSLVLISLLPIIFLTGMNRVWAAGKALSYISPYFMFLFFMPLSTLKDASIKKLAINPLFFLLMLQILFGLTRIYASANPDGILYDAPYPGGSEQWIKQKYNWNVDELYPLVKDSNLIKINVDNLSLENYLFIYLYTIDKDFCPQRLEDVIITQKNKKFIANQRNK